MFSNVLVGVDGQFGGRDAIALARQLTPDDGRLALAHMYPSRGDPLHRDYGDYEAAQYAHARDLLNAAREEAAVRAELHWSACTAPGRGLHELAESLRSDLLIVGSSGRGLLGRVMVGDDTRAALDGAPCPVAVAPAGYAEHPSPIRKIGVGYDGPRTASARSTWPGRSPVISMPPWRRSSSWRTPRACSELLAPATTPPSTS
jgi:nucleotide-binding universal stress UspA family protein